MALTGWSVRSAMTLRTCSNMPPTLVPASARISSSGQIVASFAMMASAPSSTGTSAFCLMADERDLAGRNTPLFDVAFRSLDDDRASCSHQCARDGHDLLGIFRIEMEKGRNIVGIAKLLDRPPGPRDFDCCRHSHRHTVDVLHFIDNRNRLLQPVIDQDAIVLLHDRSRDGQTARERAALICVSRILEFHLHPEQSTM